MATIVDVAKEAGVSIATVSRAINDSTAVSDEKRRKIEAAMEKLGYLPPERTRGKAKPNGGKFILFLTSFFTEIGFFGPLQDRLTEMGYEIIFRKVEHEDSYQVTLEWLRKMEPHQVAGVFIYNLNSESFNDQLAELLQDYAVIQIDEKLHMKRNFVVSVDNNKAAFDMVSHLIDKGRKRIALITIPTDADYVVKKEGGYLYALWNNGIAWEESLKIETRYGFRGGYEAGLKLLQSPQRPDAVFCISDGLALGCMKALTDHGVKIPEDIAVCGFGNQPFCEYSSVTLTSVDNNSLIIGTTAAAMFDDVVKGNLTQSQTIYVPHKLVLRDSTEGIGFGQKIVD